MHKSLRTVHAIICFGLLTLVFILAWYIKYPSVSSFENWLSMTFLIAILLGSQSLIHLFISRMELSHTLAWQLFSVFACVFTWIYLFLDILSPDMAIQEVLLEMLKSFVGLLAAHGIILGDYLLTKHLLSKK